MSCGHRAINIAAQLLLEVLWTLLDLSPSGSVPHLRKRALYSSHVYVSHSSVSLSFFPYSSFFFFHPPDLCLSVTTYTPTESISFYFFTPLCCISITRQNGYGLLLGSHLHISLSYIFQKVVRGLHSFSLLQWLFEQIGYTGAAEWGWYWDGVPSEQLIPSFFFLSEVIHAWLDKKSPLLSTKRHVSDQVSSKTTKVPSCTTLLPYRLAEDTKRGFSVFSGASVWLQAQDHWDQN